MNPSRFMSYSRALHVAAGCSCIHVCSKVPVSKPRGAVLVVYVIMSASKGAFSRLAELFLELKNHVWILYVQWLAVCYST